MRARIAGKFPDSVEIVATTACFDAAMTVPPASPEDRAFVLQLAPETDAAHGVFVGRVEHVASGRSLRFQSVEQALAFVTRVLTTPRTDA
jgi:hypothetical protein